MKSKKLFNGQAAILIVFILGMVAVLISVSQLKLGSLESFRGRAAAASLQAFYAANSGIEDAMRRLVEDTTIGNTIPDVTNLDIDGDGISEVTTTVCPTGSICNDTEKTIISVSNVKNFIRRIRVRVWNAEVKPGFLDAIHADQGGVELEGTTSIRVLSGYDGSGNVYSNSFIKGTKNDYDDKKNECKKSSSAVNGSAWAVDNIGKLESSDTGVCITENAYSGSLNYCYVNGNVESPSSPSFDCPYSGSYTIASPPDIKELPDMGIDTFKSNFTSDDFFGDCELTGDGSIDDCSNGTYQIGNLKINGDLTINPKDPNKEVEFTGPVWVTGDLVIKANTKVGIEKSIYDVSQLIVVDGTIESAAGVSFGINIDPSDPDTVAFLLFVSTLPSASEEDDVCKENDKDNIYNSIRLSSNTNSVLFYAYNGCVLVNANGSFQGAILGKKVRVVTNSDIVYDPRLENAVFGLSSKIGWQISDFEEF